MTFSEAVQAMLDGEKVKRSSSTVFDYVVIDKDGDVVCSNGNIYTFSKTDFVADWEITSIPEAGTLLMRYGKTYRLIEETDGTYAILDEETNVEKTSGIPEEHLMSEIEYQNLSLAKYTKDDIKDGDKFKNENGISIVVRKLADGKYLLVPGMTGGYTKQELRKQARKYHLNKVTDTDEEN